MNAPNSDKKPFNPEDTFKIIVDEHGLFNLKFFSVPNTKEANIAQAKELDRQTRAIFKQHEPTKMPVLVDGRLISNVKYMSSEAQQIYVVLMTHPQVKRMAFVGLNKWLKLMTSAFVKLINTWPETRWFDNMEEAHAWLEGL